MPLRPLLVASLGSLLLLVPAAARAQTISIPNERALPRLDANGAPVVKRSLVLNPEGVNRHDCEDDQRIRFPLLLAQFEANAALEAWASVSGVDCRQSTNRTGANALCWQVSDAIPLMQQVDVDVPVRRLMSGALTEPASDDRICGSIDFTSLDVQFLYFAPGNRDVAAVTKSITVVVDTIGPQPPSGLRAVPGDARVHVEWEPPGNVVTAVNVYCEPSPSSLLVPGTTPTRDFDARLRCATVSGSTSTAGVVTQSADGSPLANDRAVAVAVAAVDAFGNVGPLSEGAAATPARGLSETDDGGCSTTGTAPRRAHGAALVVALAALAGIRRRRRRVR